jgi:beta-lactamase regulating signal transducer with metallopeptidase domain
MQPILQSTLNSFSAAAVSALISAAWQGTILALAVALCLRITPRLSAAARSLVWMNVLALLVLLHILPQLFHAQLASAGHASAITDPMLDLDPRWSLAIAAIWAVLSIWRAAQLAIGAVHLKQLANRATPLAVTSDLESILKTGPAGRAAQLCMSDEVSRPSVFGFFRPRILIPPALLEALTPAELRQVVLHEMEHLRRADDWTNLLQKVALVLFPLNPALLWVERRLCAERELACDDRVLAASGGGKAYAVCLTRLAEYSILRRGFSLVLGAWERRPELARRVHRLLRRPQDTMSSVQARFVTASLMAAVMVGALVLSRSPQLISFAPLNALTVDVAALTPPSDNAAQTSASAAQASAGRVRALARTSGTPMNEGLQPLRGIQAKQNQHSSEPQLVQAMAQVPAKPTHLRTTFKPVHKPATQPSDQPEQYPIEGTWMVLTDWSDDYAPPRPVLLTFNHRGTYAAVPVIGGWLIVRI